MADRLTGSGTKQGDHVFNDLRAALERPIDSMREARVEGLNGDHFLTDFLPYGVDLAKRILRDPGWQTVRQYTATPGEEPQALLRLSRVAANRPLLAGITKDKLVRVHLQNADRFGAETRRFESQFLIAMRHALTVATEHPDTPNNANLIFGTGTPVMAFQSLVDAAFDPAAALVIVIACADRENVLGQSSVLTFLENVWKTIDPWRPALWIDTWNQFRETRQPAVTKLVHEIGSALGKSPTLKVTGQSEILLTLSEAAGGRKPNVPQGTWLQQYGYMIAALTARIEQLRTSPRS